MILYVILNASDSTQNASQTVHVTKTVQPDVPVPTGHVHVSSLMACIKNTKMWAFFSKFNKILIFFLNLVQKSSR